MAVAPDGPRRIESSRELADTDLAGADDALLHLALSRPAEAVAVAERALATASSAHDRSYALQTRSIAARELGDGPGALRYARRAVTAAERSGQAERCADTRATLGATLALLGRSRAALDELDAALRGSTGPPAARIRMRRGGVLLILGRHEEAMDDVRQALPVLHAAGDLVYEARALTCRALVQLERGHHDRSDRDFARAEKLMRAAGQALESAVARHHRGQVAYRAGDLPLALRHFDQADRLYREVGEPDAELDIDRCRTLLAAGLPRDAARHARSAVATLASNTAYTHQRADALLTAARAALAAGDHVGARRDAGTASRLFRLQHRERWALRARRTVLTARLRGGDASPSLLRSMSEVARQLGQLRDAEAVEAHLTAGRLALRLGRGNEAAAHLQTASLARHRGSAITRSSGWLARALLAEAGGQRRATTAACRRGLDLLDEHRLSLGATEMRARASVHGAELAAIGLRSAVARGDAGQLLWWSERWRATTLSTTPVRPPDDDALLDELSELRGVTGRLDEARSVGSSTAALEREQARLELSIRNRTLRTSGDLAQRAAGVDSQRVLAALAGATLLDLVESDRLLHVVRLDPDGTARSYRCAPVEEADAEVDFARFGLRRAAVATTDGAIGSAARSLVTAGEALQRVLLGAAAEGLPEDVVIIPSGRLHAVPWSLLPVLAERSVAVAPSVSSWLRSAEAPPPESDQVTLVVGPDLASDGAEVLELAPAWPGGSVLTGEHATVARVLGALDGASLAHIAAHGTFRADNPLFSSLRLTDGPLTVHDLERLHRPPHRLLLSSCDSGLAEIAGADELLGLTSALIALGTAGLLASVVPVNDLATVRLMVAVHDGLRSGLTLARALRRARSEIDPADAVLLATAMSFVALGAA